MRKFLKRLTVILLTLEARLVLRKYRPHIVAITGSVGKTSTKDAIYAVLAESRYVRKSNKSFNSDIGLPLTILGCPNAWDNPFRWLLNLIEGFFLIILPSRYPEWLVLEAGADRPGDIRSLASWLPTDVVVITHLPEVPVHVEFFDSPEAVVAEKASLINTLRPGGIVVLYGDDDRVRQMEQRGRLKGARIITYGLSSQNDVRGSDFAFLREGEWPAGTTFRITSTGLEVPVAVHGVVGPHMMLSTIAAAAVGKALSEDTQSIARGLSRYEAPQGRMHLIAGLKDTLIIDDTYNSSPAAVKAALETLREMPTRGRRIAVIGDMLELGKHSVEEHTKMGKVAAGAVDLLLTVGFRARDIAAGALDAGMQDSTIRQYEEAETAGKELEEMLQGGDCILVKGSQSMRMERVVEEIMLEPERAGELLVRQESEWKRR